MNISRLQRLVQLVEGHDIDELEVSRWGSRVRIVRRLSDASRSTARLREDAGLNQIPAERAQHASELQNSSSVGSVDLPGIHPIRSPIVGTFYRSPSPDDPPYVSEGDRIRSGQVVGVVEAMKIMNEIESDIDGEIIEVLVDNAHPVEYNQPLFSVRPT